MRKQFLGLLLVAALVVTGCAARSADQNRDLAWEEGSTRAPANVYTESAVSGDAKGAVGDDITPMIIYTGSLNLVVLDSMQAQEDVQRLAAEAGGYVAASESYRYEEGSVRITMTLRVPAGKFDEVMSKLRGIALEVERDSVSSENVTQEYVDLESRLRALEVKAARLEELMEDAEDTEAVLAVYRELSATQQEIEQVKGRMQYLERAAAMATISVALTPDALSKPIEVAGWRPQGTAKRAVEALVSTLQFLGNALIWIVIFIVPVLAVVAAVIYFVISGLSRLFGRRRRSKKTDAPAAPLQ